MIEKLNKAIPAKSLGYIFVCGGIILIVVLGLVSFQRYNSNKAQSVKKLENQIEEQKGFGPVYLLMLKELKRKEVYALPNPQKTKLSRQETDRFVKDEVSIAGQSGVMTVSVLPDVKSIASSSPSLMYNVILKGELNNFRKFIIELGGIPYIDHIEEVSIKQYSDSMECRLKIWIALSD